MPLSKNSDTFKRHWYAGGGVRGSRPVRPMLKGEWRPGMPCHWMEQSKFFQYKFFIARIVMIFQFVVSTVYLQYRARETIGIFERSKQAPYFAYQIFFLCLEAISVAGLIFRFFEIWRVCYRNCIDFKQIPHEFIAPHPSLSSRSKVRPEHKNYPSVGVFIPCYNEDADLVLETVLGAVNIDYPPELLAVYLCDDGKDPLKRSMVSQLREHYKNVHYVVRPEHTHAKAGNLNYSLERTTTDMVVTLDADFVARPNLLQRLLPYYYVWNPATGMYEFNETLAVVQTPQQFRNLSPYDSDPLDQRSILFFELTLPGKDWFNASTMIGTTNLLARGPLREAGYFPYFSITEDTAMSLAFHRLGYRTYYVKESLATGLATTTLWSNLKQRARWLKGDWQIFFSKNGPAAGKGLTFMQRLLYLQMIFARLISIIHLMYDISAVLVLLAGIAPLDAPDAKQFIIYLALYLGSAVLTRCALNFGGHGWNKSESGAVAFEAIFRYITIKGIFMALFRGKNLKFKVTDKSGVAKMEKEKALNEKKEVEDESERFDENAQITVVGQSYPEEPTHVIFKGNGDTVTTVETTTTGPGSNEQHSSTSGCQEDASLASLSDECDGRALKRALRTPEEKALHRKDVQKNLRRVWFNILMAAILAVSVVIGLVSPPSVLETQTIIENGKPTIYQFGNVVPLAMALGFALINLLPHLLAVYLCFIPYVSGWMMTDFVHGRCDQYAIHPRNGKLFVPWAFISLLDIAKLFFLIGSLAAVLYFVYDNENAVSVSTVQS